MLCKCKEFQLCMNRINNVVIGCGIRKGIQYPLGEDFVSFKYCPWCGKELIDG